MKAYDLKVLAQHIKTEAAKRGLTLAEEALEELAASVYFASKTWMKESAPISKTKLDDLVVPYLDSLDSFVLPQIKKIDLDGDGQ